jgi:hypothetical protein
MSSRFNKHIIDGSKGCNIQYEKLAIAKDSHYSCLMPHHIPQVNSSLLKRCGSFAKNKDVEVYDMTANIGVDSMNFSNIFGGIIYSVESNSETYDKLFYNIHTLKMSEYIKPIYANSVDIIETCREHLKNKIIYFDPPWGGKEYWKEKKLMLTLTNSKGKTYEIWELINMLMEDRDKKYPIILKAPVNIDYTKIRLLGNFDMQYDRIYKKPNKYGKTYTAYFLYYCYHK